MLHGGSGGQFIGYFVGAVHQKTLSKTLQVRFYVFEGTTCPKLLLSYAASERLGIIEFKVPNKSSTSSPLGFISTTKNITFSKPLQAEKVPSHNLSNSTLSSVIKNNTFQDHCLQDHCSAACIAPLHNHSTSVAPIQDHISKSIAPS